MYNSHTLNYCLILEKIFHEKDITTYCNLNLI